MSKKNKSEPSRPSPMDTAPGETHMDVYKRLVNVKNMHGTPGQPKGKSS